MATLFDDATSPPLREPLEDGAVLLRAFATPDAPALVSEIARIAETAPFRHLVVPGGHTMSVAMTNCGDLGWVTDRTGYRYTSLDPANSKPWPPMPTPLLRLAQRAATAGGFPGFTPNACLINRYAPGTRLSLHQDKNEQDYTHPNVSVSLGLPAVFLFGGMTRKVRPRRMRLESGDVVVWGGPTRLAYHGVAPLKPGDHPLAGPVRINLTFRKAR